MKAVDIKGVGNWVAIKNHLGTTRTGTQLRDKWRNIVKSKYGPVPDDPL